VSSDASLIQSIRLAVEGNPEDVRLRLHLAELLLDAGDVDEAISHLGTALQRDPSSSHARALMARAVVPPPPATPPATASTPPGQPPTPPATGSTPPTGPATPPNTAPPSDRTAPPTNPIPSARPPVPEPVDDQNDADDADHVAADTEGAAEVEFDWASAEQQLAGVVPPRYAGADEHSAYDIEDSGLRLDDVGGMVEVKKRLQAAFLAPMRNEKLRQLYGKSLRGGLLLYGPPGCGKTFLARAIAGELGARFLAVGLNDVLDMWIGSSERNLHEVFSAARRAAPCVLFLDEIDALGHKRSQTALSGMRGAVNQLLTELDGVGQSNDGVFVLAATNHPWDVDGALRRPGRLDRTVLVLPPDEPARESILRYHLKGRPIAEIDVRGLAKRTHGYSGADLAHLCETASERALMDSVESGEPRLIVMADMLAALAEVHPSIGGWLSSARNVVQFGNTDGTYDDLRSYLKREKLL
jgi:AAA+ superfamily predicted ATPase